LATSNVLIEGDCQLAKNAKECQTYPDGRTKSPQPGPFTYFIYHRRLGVLSVGFADIPAASNLERNLLARKYILRGDEGLLGERI